MSKLDPELYDNQNSSIIKEHIKDNLDGLTIEEKLSRNHPFSHMSATVERVLPLNLNLKLEELLVEEMWLEALPGELHKPYAKKLCNFVESEIRGDCDGTGVPIYLPPHLIFNALNTTSFDRVKAVIIGQDPYHGLGQAMGLSFSVPEGIKIPSSLANIYEELQQDLNCTIPSHGNLERWVVQGVLLLNVVLTVR
ncbi:hypothetical protein LguiB_021020 [Lonicera macranthoides]